MSIESDLRLFAALAMLGVGWRAAASEHRQIRGPSPPNTQLSRAMPGTGSGYRTRSGPWGPTRLWRRLFSPSVSQTATWATDGDLRTLTVKGPEKGRLCLGRAHGRLLAAERGSSVLVVGPTQSRKTSGFAIPAVLEWEGPIVAASVKSDLARNTLGSRSSQGLVWVYDPTASTALARSAWSPLASANTWYGARRVARSLTDVARSSASGLTDGEFWYATAAKLLAPLLMAAAVSGRSMADVVRWLDEQEVDEVSENLERAGEGEALQAVRASWGRDERQRSAVYTTAETIVEAFADPVVAQSEGPGGIEPDHLLDSNATLYLCAPTHDQPRLRPLFATLVTQVIERAYERASRQGAPLDPPLLVVLDEAANVAPIADLDVLASTAAGHGIQLVTVWQDLGQLSARYGARAGSVINNHRVKVFLSGIADPQTLEHASQLIGEADHATISRTFDSRQGASTTQSHVARRLLPADALRRIPPGTAVTVSGHLPPVHMDLRPWYEDPMLRRRAVG